MKTMKLMKRLSALGSTVIAGLFFAQHVQAATGFCSPVGGVKTYSFAFSPTLTDPDQNITGKIIDNAQGGNWNNQGGNYPVQCDCENGSTMGASYITGTSPLPMLGSLPGGGSGQWFILNEYLAVGAKVYIAGFANKFVDVPFYNESNNYDHAQHSCNINYASGSQGSIDLYFRRPFVGVSTIPSTKLVDVYISSINGVSSPSPSSAVYMSGSVTVPQNCDISPPVVNVDFGTIMSNRFKTAGAMPDGFTKVNKQLTLGCRNISDGVVINLSFQTEPDPIYGDALKTDNDSIAVKIEDKNGNVISPNNGRLPVEMNYDAQQGTTEMNLYPINTTGVAPTVGTFNATATIKVEIQ